VLKNLWGLRTWLSLAYVVLGLPFGILTFTVTVVGLSLGVGLIPLFLIGLVVLWVTVLLVRGMAVMERARAALFFDSRPAGSPARARRRGQRPAPGLAPAHVAGHLEGDRLLLAPAADRHGLLLAGGHAVVGRPRGGAAPGVRICTAWW
jgi:hypothetical protein